MGTRLAALAIREVDLRQGILPLCELNVRSALLLALEGEVSGAEIDDD
jgi:hypothetical protein